jgi:hypothetical protein
MHDCPDLNDYIYEVKYFKRVLIGIALLRRNAS